MKAPFCDQIATINYRTTPTRGEEVLEITDGIDVDLAVENSGSSSLAKSLRCTRRGGIISQVGYLGINAGPLSDMEDLYSALEATRMQLDDIVQNVYPFHEAEEAVQSLWEDNLKIYL
ncbi:uncharacterized protein A1O9_00378 [Exophiala aquamarina CBS 119918]|uniref:Alcohol dehydrogenase-like C-terminal domain-containing protein n=1 Tax=Exophiala aquamarina CBS 119918 TaxID=1182545 RepID=A0A072PRA9_9EURO|nr:uncharacterized protein A1O9_00378 [Exophiala aquamarina CBS 119918]KEF62406.1 hypothetical protein A1O9_00378 [Exophiala aquamarina CBS 119918]